MQNIEPLIDQVEAILKEIPETRNSDITLMIEIWKRYYGKTVFVGGMMNDYFIYLKDLYELPREDHVSRIRRKFCEEGFLWAYPTSREVAKQRAINEMEWWEKVGTRCFGGRCINGPKCPNVRPGYHFHTEVKCQGCGKLYTWGNSWDQDNEKNFFCDGCLKVAIS